MKPVNLNQILKDILLVVVIAAVVLGSNLALEWSDSLYPSRTIMVSGEGRATVTPDIAKLSFSVVSEGPDPTMLQSDNSEKMNAAIDFVKGKGIKAKDIKTTNYNLSPRYEYDESRRQSFITGYTLTQTVSVKVRNLGGVAKILGGLSGLGVNNIGSVSFEVDEPDKYLDEARVEAFNKASKKASEMASLNGVRIKRVVNFGEYQSGPIYPYGSFDLAGKGGGEAMSSVPSIEPGTEEITIQVSITYEIE